MSIWIQQEIISDLDTAYNGAISCRLIERWNTNPRTLVTFKEPMYSLLKVKNWDEFVKWNKWVLDVVNGRKTINDIDLTTLEIGE